MGPQDTGCADGSPACPVSHTGHEGPGGQRRQHQIPAVRWSLLRGRWGACHLRDGVKCLEGKGLGAGGLQDQGTDQFLPGQL